ncbi:MAG: YihY/virulence factor BrkB family protein [Prevotellaceae bacterium]|nr:YihY/virulence factor BrkB family protein [Prevotellaceae bacterium]
MKKNINIFAIASDFIKRSVKFVTRDIWYLTKEKPSRSDSFLTRQLKIIIIAIRSFIEDKITVRASALTYYTLMSLIPIAALIFAMAKGFNYENELRTFLFENFSEQQDLVEWVLNFVDSTLKNTKNGLIAGIGVVMLLWACLKLLIHIEESFNHVWNVKNPRSWKNRITNYLAVFIIAPVFLMISISVSLAVNHDVSGITSSLPFLESISPVLNILYECIPYVSVWILFALIYKFMPNTRVRFSHALLAGIIAGSLFQLTQDLYVYSQVSITKFSAIYGTFAAIPLFLMWAQLSWLIVLLGAELAFAYQNIDTYESEKESEHTSFYQRKILALLIMRMIAINFKNQNKPPEISDISEKLAFPTRIVRTVVNNLVESGILSEVVSKTDKEYGYQPAFDINRLTVATVFSHLEKLNNSDFTSDNENYKDISKLINTIWTDFENSPENKLLIDI